jgi:hypothetical protein
MAKVPTSGKKASYRDDDYDDENLEEGEKPKKPRHTLKDARASFATHLLETADAPAPGRPPKTDDEKREVFRTLAVLRSMPGSTYEDCAQKLGVSRSTIGTWLSDPLYKDICNELYQDGKRQGFVSASTLVADSFAMLYHLAQHANSDFVKYSALKTILEHAGLTQPMIAMVDDDTKEVSKFLELARQRGIAPTAAPPQQVNVHVSITSESPQKDTTTVVDALPIEPALPPLAVENSLFELADQEQLARQQAEMLAEYSQPLEPGGKLPGSESYLDKMRAMQKQNDRDY